MTDNNNKNKKKKTHAILKGAEILIFTIELTIPYFN